MKKAFVSICLVAVLATCVLVFSLPASMQERWAKPTATIKTISISACEFRPKHSMSAYPQWQAEISKDLKLVYSNPTHANFKTPSFFAPIILPEGSEIVKIKMYCIDNGSYQITVKLDRFSNTGSVQTLFTLNSTGASSSYRVFNSAWSPVTLDNTSNSYFLKLIMPKDGSISGVFNCVKVFYRNATW